MAKGIDLVGLVDSLSEAVNFALGIQNAVWGVSEVEAANLSGVSALLDHHIDQLNKIHEQATAAHKSQQGGKGLQFGDNQKAFAEALAQHKEAIVKTAEAIAKRPRRKKPKLTVVGSEAPA